ncbi:MAG: DUF177 domain-containing protein [Bacilli bacterium]|nr:DUF177 domain-containing protein [Bacilli bacterium]MDD4733449.1 DUF177 domain-containing protein [Bacilli bacterium]
MKFDVLKLNKGVLEFILVDEDYSFSQEQLKNSGILRLDNVHINGEISLSDEDYQIILNIKGTMILPCSLTLKEVEYPFNINIDNNMSDLLEEIDKNSENKQNTIDILPIIWQNILMEVPIKVTSTDLGDFKTSGDGWKIITEPETNINPELERLKDLL